MEVGSQGREQAPYSCGTMKRLAVVGKRMTGSTDPSGHTASVGRAGGRTLEDMTIFADEQEGGV